jgi:hypothetical protein
MNELPSSGERQGKTRWQTSVAESLLLKRESYRHILNTNSLSTHWYLRPVSINIRPQLPSGSAAGYEHLQPMRSTMVAGWTPRERDTRKAADTGENISCTTHPGSPNTPTSPSSSRSSSFNISLAWDFEDEKMSHVTPPGSPLKIRRTFSDRLFRRSSDLSQPDAKLGLRTFYEPPDADVE